MPGTKTSALSSLTAVADGDLLPIVDISDTTQAASGSTKKTTAEDLATYVGNRMLPYVVIEPSGGDDTAPINVAAASVAPGGWLFMKEGNWVTSGLVTFTGINVAMPTTLGTQITYSGTGNAILVDRCDNCHISLSVTRGTRLWDTTDSTSEGIVLRNTTHARLDVDIREFWHGLVMRGSSATFGCQYNIVDMYIVDCKVGLIFESSGGGWANQNTFLGRIAYFSGAASYVGTRMIDLSAAGNNNTFISVGLEGAAHEKCIVCATNYNQWLNCRWESSPANSIEFQAASGFNKIDGGFGLVGATDTKVSDSGSYNQIISVAGSRMSFATAFDPRGLHLRGQTGFPTVLAVGPSDNTIRGEVDAQGRFIGYDAAGKVANTAKIVYLDGSSTTRGIAFTWTDGTAIGRMYAYNATHMGIIGNVAFGTTNTHDFGVSGAVPRDINLGRNLVIGGAIDHNGTTIGFNGAAPTAKSAGWGAPTGTATKTTFDTATVTLPQLAERLKALIDYLTLRGDIGA